jgi:MoxR-like ATPase
VIEQQQAQEFEEWFNLLLGNVGTVIRGKQQQVAMALVCMLSEGHLLLEDLPGTGKTTLAKSLANSFRGDWSRVQFTPDLLPSDETGGLMYNQGSGDFSFKPGPIFANVVLADEINRASPKTQSALLEAMEERQVTIGGQTYYLDRPFVVIATQNPVEQGGTYDLPEAQLDRFMMRLTLGYPFRDAEVDVLGDVADNVDASSLAEVMDTAGVREQIAAASRVHVSPEIRGYIVDLADATRRMSDVLRLGVSTRGCVALMKCSRTLAAAQARTFVTADDVKAVAHAVMEHRMLRTARAELDHVSTEELVENILRTVPAPGAIRSTP